MSLYEQNMADRHLTVGSLEVLGQIQGPDYQDVRDEIERAQNHISLVATAQKDFFEKLSADNVITPTEKRIVKKEMDVIDTDMSAILHAADKAGVSAASVVYLEYTDAYNALRTELYTNLKLFDNMSESTTLTDREGFNAIWKRYYEKAQALQDAIIDAKLKDITAKPIQQPDISRCIFYFSCDDVEKDILVNNARKNSIARLTGGKQVSGIAGNAIRLASGQHIDFKGIIPLTSLSFSLFFKLETYGVICQRCKKALLVKAVGNSITVYPDPSQERVIAKEMKLNVWYGFIYTYNNETHTETVTIAEYKTDTAGNGILDKRDEYQWIKERSFATDWETSIEQDIDEASGILDSIRLDTYAWSKEEQTGWLLMKGTSQRLFTLSDYRVTNIHDTVADAAPRYLGKRDNDPNEIARVGDWYAYSGETTAERIKGRCYRRVSSTMWVVVDSWQENIAAMPDLLSIADEAINNSLPAGQFTSVLAACDVFAKRLVANEAFINRLATNEAFVDKLITKKLLVDSDTANPDNFELAINEQVGILAKKSSEKIFEITPDGRGFFCGSIEAGPLSLSLKSPGERVFSFNVGTRVYLICKSVATSIHGAGLFYCSGSYGDKKLKAISFSYETRKQYVDRIGGKYFVGGGFWGKIYQKIWRAESTWQTGTIEFIYNDDVKETIKEAMTEILFFHVKDEFVRNDTRLTSYEESFADPSNSTSGVVEITKPLNIVVNADSHTLLLKKLPLGTDPSYISGMVYRDNDGRLFVVP